MLDLYVISKYTVALIDKANYAKVKFTHNSNSVESNIPDDIIANFDKTLSRWESSPLSMSKIALQDILTGVIPDVLAVSGYPSLTIRKTQLGNKTMDIEFISEEADLVVAGFNVDNKKMPPTCFSKCFVLTKDGGNKRITGPAFDYFHQEILPYTELDGIKLQEGSAVVTDTRTTREKMVAHAMKMNRKILK